MPPEAPMHSATQGLLVKKIFVQMFHMRAHPPICMHDAHAHVCTWQQLKQEEKSAILGVGKMMDTENIAYPVWKL